MVTQHGHRIAIGHPHHPAVEIGPRQTRQQAQPSHYRLPSRYLQHNHYPKNKNSRTA